MFAAQNLVSQSLFACDPWAFKGTENITAQIRHDKQARQEFYNNQNTRHCFYTAFEASNPNQRPTKQNNPVRMLHGFAVDYDVAIPDARVDEAVAAMNVKPAWVERSLGGGVRLVWTFEKPILLVNHDHATFLLQRAVKWLNLDMLPGLDSGAFTDPTRLLCNGLVWRPTGHGPVPSTDTQAFFIECAARYRFPEDKEAEIPLDIVEKTMRDRYPKFNWPVEFALESQGPSFWVEGSTSPLSAIVKRGGMFTFSAHASKPFFSWADLLGTEFTSKFKADLMSRATDDVWWDSKSFWMKKDGVYTPVGEREMERYLRVCCRLSGKSNKEGVSQVDIAVVHIQREQAIEKAAPFVGRPTGITFHQGKRKLNLWVNNCVRPADELSEWGDGGKFPLCSTILDRLFNPSTQLPHFLAWWKHYYNSILNEVPMPGQNVILMGGVNVGKTWTNRNMVGASVGGFADASNYLVHGGSFNEHLFYHAHWAVDDEAMAESEQARINFTTACKRMAANADFETNAKFLKQGATEWMGRLVITSNLDFISSRNIGTLDNSSGDKTHLFRCAEAAGTHFPARTVLTATTAAELPYLLRWLLEWTPPQHVIPDVRYGFRSYHEPSLREQAYQSSKTAPFFELLNEALTIFFKDNPSVNEWRGTVTQITRMLHSNPLNTEIVRQLKLEQTHRYLEILKRDGHIRCDTDTDAQGNRVWVFYRGGTGNTETTNTSSAAAVTPPAHSEQWTSQT